MLQITRHVATKRFIKRMLKSRNPISAVLETARPQRELTVAVQNMASNNNFTDSNFKDLLPYAKSNEITHEFMYTIFEKIFKYLVESNNRESKVVNFKTPDELQKILDFGIKNKGESLETICNDVDKILEHVIRTAHPRFCNPLWAGVDTTVLMGEWLTSATNTSMYTYEMAPVYLVMEKLVWETMTSVVGFKNGDGQFLPGGSLCNTMAMNIARFKFFPNVKETGVYGMKRLIVYTSEESHYSISKSAALCGLGTQSVVKVKTDDSTGKMIPADLENQIQESIKKGDQPMMVVGTAGTTVGGAYDSIEDLADICEKHKLWLHVDGAWGGSCLLSNKYKHLMKGCERIDSLTWDPHKMMGLLQQCSFLLVKEKGLLQQCNSAYASYLFQQDKRSYDVSWDTGDKTFQCGRRNDILKLWLTLKAKGLDGIEEDIDKCFDNSRYLTEQIRKRENFELLREPQCTNVCFQYTPPRIAAMPDGPEKIEQRAKVAPEIKKRMTDAGTMMVAYQPLKKLPNFFRMINSNPAQTHDDMDFVLNEIERLGKDL